MRTSKRVSNRSCEEPPKKTPYNASTAAPQHVREFGPLALDKTKRLRGKSQANRCINLTGAAGGRPDQQTSGSKLIAPDRDEKTGLKGGGLAGE